MPSKDQGDPAAKCLRKAWWFSMVACAKSFRGQGPPHTHTPSGMLRVCRSAIMSPKCGS